LSLFTEQQLREYAQLDKQMPIIRMVEHEHQLKTIDLSEYRAGSELKHFENVKQWV
jgi:hypothetical protein